MLFSQPRDNVEKWKELAAFPFAFVKLPGHCRGLVSSACGVQVNRAYQRNALANAGAFLFPEAS